MSEGQLTVTIDAGLREGLARSAGLELYRRLVLIRSFEEAASVLYRDSEIPGFLHLSLGQEAAAVGGTWPLRVDDMIVTTHRGHGHVLGKGLGPTEMFAELMGRATGTCKGRGGSMHIADPSRGILGANGIVGAGLPIAVGAATAVSLRGGDQVVVAFFGDGAISQGAYHEAMNLASLDRLPVVFVCENNGFAEFSQSADQHPHGLRVRVEAYGMPYLRVDGNDVLAMALSMSDVVRQVRSGRGPVFVEATTNRARGHYEGDPQRYRTSDAEPVDALSVAASDLQQLGVPAGELENVRRAVEEEIARSIDQARSAPRADPSDVGLYVWSRPPTPRVSVTSEPTPVTLAPSDVEEWRTSQAIRAALEAELAADADVFLAGIDVGRGGNVFGLTRNLHERFLRRVRDTPISETAIMGLGVGAAMAGLKPVVELMYIDFLGVCLDQLMNQAAKMRLMTGGAAQMSLTVRTQFGAGRSSGAQHSQSLEAMLAHIPGLKVVMPATAADAYGLLRSAIQDPDPVVFIENRLLYERKGPKPDESYRVPLGSANVVRSGSALTVVTYSRMLQSCLDASDTLAGEFDVEIIDLRSIVPLDKLTILESVKKTGRLLIVHEAVEPFGVGAEISAMAADEAFWFLDAPIGRVGALAQPAPYAPELEAAWLPSVSKIAEAMRRTALA